MAQQNTQLTISTVVALFALMFTIFFTLPSEGLPFFPKKSSGSHTSYWCSIVPKKLLGEIMVMSWAAPSYLYIVASALRH